MSKGFTCLAAGAKRSGKRWEGCMSCSVNRIFLVCQAVNLMKLGLIVFAICAGVPTTEQAPRLESV